MTLFQTSFPSPSLTLSTSIDLELNFDHILQQLFMQYHQELRINLKTTSELPYIILTNNHHQKDIIKNLSSIWDTTSESIEHLLVTQPSPSKTHTPYWLQLASVTSSSYHQRHLLEPPDIELKKSQHHPLPHQAATLNSEGLNFTSVWYASRISQRKILRLSHRGVHNPQLDPRSSTTSQERS